MTSRIKYYSKKMNKHKIVKPQFVVGLIGGTGVYNEFNNIKAIQSKKLETPYGIVTYTKGTIKGNKIIFISRHGKGKRLVPPHRVNYKANIYALKKLGVSKIISTTAVGVVSKTIPIGSLILPDQLIDFTKQIFTFYEGNESGVMHVDFVEPFSASLRNILYKNAKDLKIDIYLGGTYVCFSGPSFETAAEILFVKFIRGRMIGMTVAPEAKLARELEINYQPIAIAVNRAGDGTKIIHEKNIKIVKDTTIKISKVIERTLKEI